VWIYDVKEDAYRQVGRWDKARNHAMVTNIFKPWCLRRRVTDLGEMKERKIVAKPRTGSFGYYIISEESMIWRDTNGDMHTRNIEWFNPCSARVKDNSKFLVLDENLHEPIYEEL